MNNFTTALIFYGISDFYKKYHVDYCVNDGGRTERISAGGLLLKRVIIVYFKPATCDRQFDFSYISTVQWLVQDCNLRGSGTHALNSDVAISINDSINETHRFVCWEVVEGNAVIADPTATATTVRLTDNAKILPVLELIPVGPDYDLWNNTTPYPTGSKVTHNNKNWEAKWWNQRETPGVSNVWTEIQ